jgi:hypothetical protein
MMDDAIKDIKSEVRFFMDKSFQSSFAYIGALVAAIFSLKLDPDTVSRFTSVNPSLLLSSIILLTNFIFLTVNIGCSFAVVKRGMFIVASFEQGASNPDVEWETFLRTKAGRLGWFGWNTDNFYLVPIVVVVVVLSIVIFGSELPTLSAAAAGARTQAYILLIFPMALHAWPAWSSWQLVQLMQDHARLLESLGSAPQAKRLT